MSNRTITPTRALVVMGCLIAAVPAYLYLSAVVTGGFEDSGPVSAAIVLLILTIMLAVVFLPAIAAVLGKDPIRLLHLGLFTLALLAAHGVALLVAAASDSNSPLLAYPVMSVLAWFVLRERADPARADQSL